MLGVAGRIKFWYWFRRGQELHLSWASEEGAMGSGKVLFRGTYGWRRFVEDRIDAQGFSGFSDYVGVGSFHCVTE